MSGSLHAWYSLRALETLGSSHGVLTGEIEQNKLSRLAQLLYAAGGSVKATLQFRQRKDGRVTLALDFETTVELTCQRCLEPVTEHIAEHVDLLIVKDDTVTVPEGYEPLELNGDRLQPAQVIEDELIVSIPLVPKHVRVEDCGSLARRLAALAEDPTQKVPSPE